MLAFYWGDAILDKKGMALEEAYSIARSPKSEVLAYSYQCLDEAAKRLPNSYSSIQRATKGAALAFKARIALRNGDYETAATAAKACMDMNVYKLHSNYQDLFTTNWSDEWIFFFRGDVTLKQYYWVGTNTRGYLPRVPGGYGGSNAVPSYELICAYPCTDGKPIDKSPLYNPKDIFENRDPRMTMTVLPFATAYSKSILDGTYDPEDYVWLGYEHSPDPTLTTVYRASDGEQVSNTDSKSRAEHASYNGFLFKKYLDETSLENAYKSPITYPMLRYGDVLLMYAEAMIELDRCNQDVLDATINKLRERAYVDTGLNYPKAILGSQTSMRTLVRTERFIELAFEGHRYADLLRWRLAEKVYNRPSYYLSRAWSGSTSWNGNESSVSAEYRHLIKNWKEGNYPIGGTPQIDDNGIADVSYMVDAGYIVVASERVFNANRDYLWPVPAADRLINKNLDQNPNW